MFENLLARRAPAPAGDPDLFTLMQREFNRAFDGLFRPGWNAEERGTMAFWPKIEVADGPEGYDLTAELPGLTEKDVQCHVSGNVLTLKGEKKSETRGEKKPDGKGETDKRGWHYTERSYGMFQRTFTLPTEVDADRITAQFKNGVLHVRLPKTAKAMEATRQVKITHE